MTGTIQSSTGDVIPNGTIEFVAPGFASDGPRPILNGRINERIDAHGLSAVRCLIAAPNHNPATLNVDIIEGKAQLGKVVLVEKPGIKVSKLYYFPPSGEAATSSGDIDFYVSNTGDPSSLRVEKVQVIGTLKRKTDCGDVPGLHAYVFKIRNDVHLGAGESKRLLMDLTAPSGSDSAVNAVVGQIEYLHCGQARLRFSIAYPWNVDGERKIRVTLPVLPARPPGPGKKPAPSLVAIDLSSWDLVRVDVVSSDGRTASSELR